MLGLGTFWYAFGSALLPFLNAELFLIAIGDRVSHLQFALIAAGGQTAGKVIWYEAGRHAMRSRWLTRKMESVTWQATYARWHSRLVGRPVAGGAIVFASAVGGVPPMAVVAVLAGSLRMNLITFVTTTFVGRAIRFWLCLATGAGVWELIHALFG